MARGRSPPLAHGRSETTAEPLAPGPDLLRKDQAGNEFLPTAVIASLGLSEFRNFKITQCQFEGLYEQQWEMELLGLMKLTKPEFLLEHRHRCLHRDSDLSSSGSLWQEKNKVDKIGGSQNCAPTLSGLSSLHLGSAALSPPAVLPAQAPPFCAQLHFAGQQTGSGPFLSRQGRRRPRPRKTACR